MIEQEKKLKKMRERLLKEEIETIRGETSNAGNGGMNKVSERWRD